MTPPLNLDETEAFYSDDPVRRVEPAPRKKRSGLLALVLLGAAGFFIQNTFAGNISIDSGKKFEFGQGVTQSVACSGLTEILITPNSVFVNGAGTAGVYKFKSVTVSEIPDSCFGVDFLIRGYNETDDAPLSLFSTDSKTAVIYDNAGTFEVGTGGAGTSITNATRSFTIIFDTPVVSSASVYRISIQSGVHTPKTYSVGEIGAGGGIVFYVSATPFPCGATLSAMCTSLEAAPSNWNATPDIGTAWCISGTSSTQNALSGTHPTRSAIGAGLKNSIAIAAGCTGGAANVALAYRGAGLSDWYLPDLKEWELMYAKYSTLGFPGADYYELSDEVDATGGALGYLGGPGSESYAGKSAVYRVRPIRAF